jgi:cytochrome P450
LLDRAAAGHYKDQVDFNPFDHSFQSDPYPTYSWLREQAPVYYNPQLDFWALSRFDDVLAAVLDTATFTSTKGVALEDDGQGAAKSMIHMDPPDHTRMRKLVSKRFTPRRVAELEDTVRGLAKELASGLDGRTQFDVVQDYSALLPASVISVMLGIPEDEHDNVRTWTDDYLTRPEDRIDQTVDSREAETKLVTLAATYAAQRRAAPNDDILSLLVTMEFDGAPLTDADVIGMSLLLISGGHETTSKLIANGIRLFGRHPDQRAAVIEDPELMAPAVEELLRYTSPTQYMTRTTTRDVTVRDTVIPQGSKVALLFGSANRDPQEFSRPDDFDIFRPRSRMLAFGRGAHVCLGAAVARLEARIALQEFLAQVPEYEVDESAITYMHSGNVQGPTAMPLSVL